MAFKEILPTEIKGNLMDAIANEWMLVTAGNKNSYNTMTASWGFTGEMWGKKCAICVIRPQRYTHDFMDREEYYTLSFYGDRKDIHKVCGSKSGRNTDKVKEAGLTPVFDHETVYFDEARLVLVCKKLYSDEIKEDRFIDKDCLQWYPEKDYHTAYVGEIVKVLVKE